MVAVNILAGIIRFNPIDFVIANVQTQRAAATAVYRAGAPDDFIFRWLISGLHCGGGAFQTKRQCDPTGGKRQRSYGSRFNQSSTAYPVVMFNFGHNSPHHC